MLGCGVNVGFAVEGGLGLCCDSIFGLDIEGDVCMVIWESGVVALRRIVFLSIASCRDVLDSRA